MALPQGVSAEELEDGDFMAQYESDVAEYIHLLAIGYYTQAAAIRVWGDMFISTGCSELLRALEANKYLRDRLTARLKTITFDEMWNSKHSIFELLRLVRNDLFVKDAVRLNAIKELNVMVGITVTDENGKTKAGRSLADFYADQAAAAKPRPIPGEDGKDEGGKAPLPH